eukprot:TRINITY_DN5239_c0_g1_i1.p1 TRINITY_DN5239_c0_g1~~TRINITY_DN5239_c0_g1_i1.p1  ORF type:complete len:356 (-),score=35.37 TRINITY_DN5239_c0_g1_i1:447-1493(-)
MATITPPHWFPPGVLTSQHSTKTDTNITVVDLHSDPALKPEFERISTMFREMQRNQKFQAREIVAWHNRAATRQYELQANILKKRLQNPMFSPAGWEKEPDAQKRRKLHTKMTSFVAHEEPVDRSSVKHLLLWHVTHERAWPFIGEGGFAALQSTDCGFFGKGVYATPEPDYACQYYATSEKDAVAVLVCACAANVYPVLRQDQHTLAGGAKETNHDVHFAAVAKRHPENPRDGNFDAVDDPAAADFHEFVFFTECQVLPMYAVRFERITAPMSAPMSAPMTVLQGTDEDIIERCKQVTENSSITDAVWLAQQVRVPELNQSVVFALLEAIRVCARNIGSLDGYLYFC